MHTYMINIDGNSQLVNANNKADAVKRLLGVSLHTANQNPTFSAKRYIVDLDSRQVATRSASYERGRDEINNRG